MENIVYLLECEIREAAFSVDRIVEFPALEVPGDEYRNKERKGYGGLWTWSGNLYAFVNNDKLVTGHELPKEGHGYMKPGAIEKCGDKARVMLSDSATQSGIWFTVRSMQLRPFAREMVPVHR